MKTLFTTLISLMAINFSFAAQAGQSAQNIQWSSEKCDAIEQVPDALTPGTFSRVLVMSSEDSWDLVLLMKVKQTGEIKSLPMGFVDGSQRAPRWENGNLSMTVDFQLGHYIVFKGTEKVLTMACE